MKFVRLLLLLVSIATVQPAFAARATNVVEAAAVASRYMSSIPPLDAESKRFVWCPGWNDNEVSAVSIVMNTALSQSPVDIRPMVLAEGSVTIIDLRLCAPDDEAYAKLVDLWSSLSEREPWFHVRRLVKRTIPSYTAKDGKKYNYEWVKAAVYSDPLDDIGRLLETLVGNPLPDEQSYCPIVQVGWLTKELLSTADGGRYYDFRGVSDDLTLDKYLILRGADREAVQKRLGSDERVGTISKVTGKARAITIFQGSGTRPSTGSAFIAITDDIFDDNVNPNSDAFRSLLETKPDGHEVFVTMPSGWLEFTLWNGDGKLVKEAPPNLVVDHRVPEPHSTKLQGAIACMRCHGPEDMWQPFVNEVTLMIGDRLRVYGDLRQKDNDKTLKRLAGLYGGDLGWAVSQAQDNFSRRVYYATHLEVPAAMKSVGDVYGSYEYEPINSARAVKELGFPLDKDDKSGVKTFRRIVPPLDPKGTVPEDPIIGRLHIEYPDLKRQERIGLTLTRRQWEQVLVDAQIRAYASKAALN